MDRVDEVASMSYRTDIEELVAISEDALRYGFLQDVPVWLAMETTRLPTERHVVLERVRNATRADGMLDLERRMFILGSPTPTDLQGEDRTWFRIHHQMTVRPERISFAGRSQPEVRRAIERVFNRIRLPIYSGLLIHDLPGYLELQH